jgi:hypothetical protein
MPKCALCGMTGPDVCLPDNTEQHKLDCIAENLADDKPVGAWTKDGPTGPVGTSGVAGSKPKDDPWALPDHVPPKAAVDDGSNIPAQDHLVKRKQTINLSFDLSHEEARSYFYPVGDGFIAVEVEAPVSLQVRNGHHYLTDEDGIGTVMADGWSYIEVFPKFGRPAFNFSDTRH